MKVWVATFEVYLGYEDTPVEKDVQVFTEQYLGENFLDDMRKQIEQLFKYGDEGPYSYIPDLYSRELIDKPHSIQIGD